MSVKLIAYTAAAVALIAGGYYAYRKVTSVTSDALDAAGEALNAINPLNNENIINQGAQSLYQSMTGSTGTIGTDLYDWMHKDYSPSVVGRPGFDPFLTYNGKDDKPVTVVRDEWRGSKL